MINVMNYSPVDMKDMRYHFTPLDEHVFWNNTYSDRCVLGLPTSRVFSFYISSQDGATILTNDHHLSHCHHSAIGDHLLPGAMHLQARNGCSDLLQFATIKNPFNKESGEPTSDRPLQTLTLRPGTLHSLTRSNVNTSKLTMPNQAAKYWTLTLILNELISPHHEATLNLQWYLNAPSCFELREGEHVYPQTGLCRVIDVQEVGESLSGSTTSMKKVAFKHHLGQIKSNLNQLPL